MTELPDDINQLKAMLLKLQEENLQKDKQLHAQAEEMTELKTKLQLLVEQLNLSQSKRFSAQSEKVAKGTFNESEQQNALPKITPHHQQKGRKPLPAEFEREVQQHTLNAPHCECCHGELHECGVEVSEQLKIIPQKVSVIRHERTKYTCRQCEKTHTSNKIITAPKPPSMIPQSIGSPEAFAAVVTAKYVDALPLYRQAEILTRSDLAISRSTLANWCVQLGKKVDVVIATMKAKLLAEPVICADETTVQVLREEDRSAERKSYMWVYRSGEFAAQPVVIYEYQPSRASACAIDFLGDYQGYLLSDGYSGYNRLDKVTQAGCMAHVRRKFNDAKIAQANQKSGKADKAMSFIAKLYRIEHKAKLLSAQERQQLREIEARPILECFHQWLQDTSEKTLPKGQLGKAIGYALNQWPKLLTYLEDGELSIDSNVTERDIRPFTTGRKNWLFSTSVGGAHASANLYSLVMTCRANDINPYYYFKELFRLLPTRSPEDDLSDLMPWSIQLSEAE
ncbi:IS66 family transposase [Motilimonas cestriensis]|uniref:IS66 family transposase n=1 Tax=Motilimonas cestriensis TaxID=2742685 RepID=A0ABS8W699_9GAMM|nr:IS66 family transposase [Motilimonas cestriensis]MCE2594040.1 IS66 family transposase [Motilimonas cestriensis]